MDFFDAVRSRRSVRKYANEPVPEVVMRKALEAAVLAPNSSNAQTWDFYWVRTPDKKQKLVHDCLDQSAARTAAELLVVVARPSAWRRSWPKLVAYADEVNAHPSVKTYYRKAFPLMYRWGYLNTLGYVKRVLFHSIGLFRPLMRGPGPLADVQMVCVKSAALACENFVLAISAQGYSTCMMEGFDEFRVKRMLRLKCEDRVVMVISVGRAASENAIWGPRYRLPIHEVVHEV